MKWTNCGSADCATIVAPLDYAESRGRDDRPGHHPGQGDRRPDRLAVREPGRPGRQRRRLRQGRRTTSSARRCASTSTSSGSTRAASASATPSSASPTSSSTSSEQPTALRTVPPRSRRSSSSRPSPALGCAKKSDPRYAHVGTGGRRTRPRPRACAGQGRDPHLPRQVVRDDARRDVRGAVPRPRGPHGPRRRAAGEPRPGRGHEGPGGRVRGGRARLRPGLPDALGLPARRARRRRRSRSCRTGSPASTPTRSAGSDRDLNEPLAAYAVLANLYFPGYDYPRLRSALAAAIERDDASADARASSTPASAVAPTGATSTTRPRPSTRSPASTGRTTGRSTTCGRWPRSGRRRRRPSARRWRGAC